MHKKDYDFELHQLHADGLSNLAHQDYVSVASQDPFLSPQVLTGHPNSRYLVVQETDRAVQSNPGAARYWAFLSQYGLSVTGAVIQPISAHLFLVASLLRNCAVSGPDFATVIAPMRELLQSVSTSLLVAAAQALEDRSLQRETEEERLRKQYGLSPADLAIVERVKKGMRNKQIAFDLSCTDYIIENRLKRIYAKVGVCSKAALVARMLAKV